MPLKSSHPGTAPPHSASSSNATAVRAHRGPRGLTRLYLFAYNVASLLGWATVLSALLGHLFPASSSSLSTRAFVPGTKEQLALLSRSTTAYAHVGDLTRWVQTAAVLEVLHVGAGLVRSGVATTVAQVASRLVMVWGILIQFPQVQSSPIFSTMVFAWCIAEIVRYATYALALYGIKLYPLEWLRYTLFYVLYPLGAGSEAYLIYSAIPWAKYTYGKAGMLVTMVLFLIWPPALLSMMSHMHAQRRKHIGGKGRPMAAKKAQ